MAENLFIQDSAGEPLMDLLSSAVPAAQTKQSMGAKVLANGQDFWQGLFGNHWTNSTWDIILLVVFAVAVLVYSFTWGRDKIAAVLMSAYLALIITTNLPAAVITTIPALRTFAYFELTVFVGLFILLFFSLSRSRLLRQTSSFHGGWWQVIVFTILQAGLLTSGIFLFLPTAVAKNFSPLTQTLFLSSIGRFCWILLPIVALIFFGGRRRHHRRRGIQSLEDFDY